MAQFEFNFHSVLVSLFCLLQGFIFRQHGSRNAVPFFRRLSHIECRTVLERSTI